MKRVSNDSNTKIAKGEMDGKGEEELKLAVVGSINIDQTVIADPRRVRVQAIKESTR